MTTKPVAKLLIVDDEAAQTKALCQTLECEGYHTTGFTSANQAVATLRNQTFDLMLTDLQMPEMDGISLVRTAVEIDPKLVCVVMTGYGTIDSAVQAMKVGALDYILKPFKLTIVLTVLARALQIRYLRMENAELIERVSERSSELEAANKELEAFSFSVSHDLRAPLRALHFYLGELAEDYPTQIPPEAQALLGRATANARRMEQLIEDLLRFSKMGRQRLSKELVKTGALVQEILDELRREHPARQVTTLVEELPDCYADPSLLRQVFVNLLSNAFKFTARKENATVEVGSRQDGSETVFFVKDNGAGFDMKYADKLFGVFQRMHLQEEFGGTGVGLSIVQRIIVRHGGRIWAEAEVDRGAAFHFSLPAIPS